MKKLKVTINLNLPGDLLAHVVSLAPHINYNVETSGTVARFDFIVLDTPTWEQWLTEQLALSRGSYDLAPRLQRALRHKTYEVKPHRQLSKEGGERFAGLLGQLCMDALLCDEDLRREAVFEGRTGISEMTEESMLAFASECHGLVPDDDMWEQ